MNKMSGTILISPTRNEEDIERFSRDLEGHFTLDVMRKKCKFIFRRRFPMLIVCRQCVVVRVPRNRNGVRRNSL